MTIYQEEMQRKAYRYGCTTAYDEERQMLNIEHKGILLAGIKEVIPIKKRKHPLVDHSSISGVRSTHIQFDTTDAINAETSIHALICRLCGVTPSFLTVVSRGGYGGFMESAGEKSGGTYTYQELMDRVCRCLAGRAAEIEVYGETAGTNTGASSDLKQARYFMKVSLNDYAMGDKLYAKWTQAELEQEMQKQYQRTCQLIRQYRPVLDALTDRLVDQKSMDQTQLEEFFKEANI